MLNASVFLDAGELCAGRREVVAEECILAASVSGLEGDKGCPGLGGAWFVVGGTVRTGAEPPGRPQRVTAFVWKYQGVVLLGLKNVSPWGTGDSLREKL